ncbi:MAG: serine/threonine-protein phosphatase [Phycisphaerae bacterium]|nr:serine/threonine-protein phosphatase [Phycisphaerae bacterium]MBT6165180.1 serine/threonine-protein phosphatase [Phycisphaerae bacterium]
MMTYLPTIFIQNNSTASMLSDALICKWPHGMPPKFTTEEKDADAALLHVNGYEDLMSILPILIDLQVAQTPTLLCCDDFGDLLELIDELGIIKMAFDADATAIAGVLFGTVERNDQVAKLRSQVGLVQNMHSSLQNDLDLLQDELEVAANVQKEFMSTEVPDVHGVSFSSLWKPASVVSGDMYDITQLDEDHVAIFIADAIGHGISAAMLAMMLTRTLSAHRYDSTTGQFTSPGTILSYLNSALLERTGDSARFATASYCIFNCKTNQLTYAGAGHPPSLLSRIGQSPILLESDGPLLGVFDNDEFPESTIDLSIGDTLLMYSDGFEFALGDNSYSEGEMPTHLKSMNEFCQEGTGELLTKINDYLNQTNSSVADDDLTMICMRANTLPAALRLAA